ncbi:MAG: DNA repair and recombination protein RadB [Candidatus Bathyarchaeota archaeon BA2]|nr:MAG: DNA repair and recombination protein RadB [Candidatus Bathyarchaeota archaeon BA2]
MKKVPTGVKGLDDMLGGGLPLGRCILVCGGPGSGKTIFGIQFLYNGAVKYGETGLYVSLGESPIHLREDMSSLGWDVERLEKDGKLVVVDASPIRTIPEQVKIGDFSIGKRDFEMLSLIEIMKKRAEEIGAKRIVIDSISSLIVQYPDDSERRNAILDLFEAVTDLGTTSLITTELRATALERQIQAEEFLSHGVIVFHTFSDSGRLIRAIQIEKMRGISHDNQLRPYKIHENGIEVFPKESVLTST